MVSLVPWVAFFYLDGDVFSGESLVFARLVEPYSCKSLFFGVPIFVYARRLCL
jgi:hypothetical protein